MATEAKKHNTYRVAAAIDFGTHGTGYAWAPMDTHNDDPVHREIRFRDGWPYQPVKGPKVLSAVLLPIGAEPAVIGYAARKRRGEARAASGTTEEWYHYAFKPYLQERQRQEPPKLTPQQAADLTSVLLREIVGEALRDIRQHGYHPDEVHWCLTVPAIWDGPAMSLTRRAAEQAGLPADPARLGLVREPEAAALYCLIKGGYVVRANREATETRLNGDARFVIADCGGGTVDISAYAVDSSSRLEQIGKMVGGEFGSENINELFVKVVLAKRIGRTGVANFASRHLDALQELVDRWEDEKVRIEATVAADGSVRITDSVNVALGVRVYRAIESVVPDLSDRLRTSQGVDDSIVVKPAELVEIFEKVIQQIVEGVDEQIQLLVGQRGSRADPETLLLVGGFSQSPYLQHRLSQHLKGRARVVVPHQGAIATAVLAGAVHSSYSSALIGTRLSAYTYGFEMALPFEDGIDPENSRMISDYGGTFCYGRFSSIVTAYESVPVDHEVRRTVVPMGRHQTEISIRVFASTEAAPRYVSGSNELGRLTVDVSSTAGEQATQDSRAVDLIFRFTGTEVAYTATEKATGLQTSPAVVAFERIRTVPPRDHADGRKRRSLPGGDSPGKAADRGMLAEQYRALAGQHVLNAARRLIDDAGPHGRLRTAKLVATISKYLFAPSPSQTGAILDALEITPITPRAEVIGKIANQARVLRKKASAAQIHIEWDFTVNAGSLLRADRQQPWANCDPADPVDFVVTPALLLDGALCCQQVVYTSPQSGESLSAGECAPLATPSARRRRYRLFPSSR
jgi:molecular chaperone DnaK (HSP70)